MREEPRTILSLVAAGRISAAEAERLIAAWRGDRELYWLAAAAVALGVLSGAFHGAATSQLAPALAVGWHWLTQHAIPLLGKGLGVSI